MSTAITNAKSIPVDPPKKRVVRAVGPRLRVLLYVVFVLLALLVANAAYLASITFLNFLASQTRPDAFITYENWFYQYMFMGHLGLGILFLVPFLAFAVIHMLNSRGRKKRNVIRVGYALFVVSLVVLFSGVALMRIEEIGLDLKNPAVRSTVYWAHVIAPLFAAWLYWLHRLVGPKIRWKAGLAYAGVLAAAVGAMLLFHTQDPREWNVVGPTEGAKYFEPSPARTATGNFIPAAALDRNEYCLRCHPDVHAGWTDSVHHLSSFNNPAYLATVRETRKVALDRDGDVRASRWCAGCHDPVPFFSGAFDDPDFDDVNHPTARAGITCTVCHSITNVNSTEGNADYTIDEPLHYPFAYSEHPVLRWISDRLVKAKPAFHKSTFLKPFHKTAEFCSTCHKVHLPFEVNHYREFLRGQNHYDSYLLSGVSGHGARSFYYPEKAKQNCSVCHMPLQESDDFGARFFGTEKLSVHDHLFPSANTAIAWLRDKPDVASAHQEFLKDVTRVDIFGLRENGEVDGELTAPIRPAIPTLQPGRRYLLETVIRTLKLGHHLTQGTVDSNELWLEVKVTSGGRLVGHSGALDEQGAVDPWAHFVNVFMLDRHGNRVDRRNAQDIFVPLYNHQIPPGAGWTVHYDLQLPENLDAPVTVEVELNYRKFDQRYMQFIADNQKPGDAPLKGSEPGKPYHNQLPVTVMAIDRVTFPVAGVERAASKNDVVADSTLPPIKPEWQRWNDYGIGLLLKGKAELKQAAGAFREVEILGRYDGPLNLARVLFREGRLDEATAAVRRAADHDDPAPPPWTVAWLSGVINREQGNLADARANFESVLKPPTTEMQRRGFDFRQDYVVNNLLGQTLFDQARRLSPATQQTERNELLNASVAVFQRTLKVDTENVTAHYALSQLYGELGDEDQSAEHRKLHARYKPDDTARSVAVEIARKKYPAADNAAEDLVIYPLDRQQE